MKRFVEGENRAQSILFPESLDDCIEEDNPVRVVDVFVDEPDLKALNFVGAEPEAKYRLLIQTPARWRPRLRTSGMAEPSWHR